MNRSIMPENQRRLLRPLVYAIGPLALAALCATVLSTAASVQPTATLRIPEGLRVEHEEIHAALEEATRKPGQVGAAARALAQVLHPHFERENQIALPPLGLLAALAQGGRPADEEAALEMTAALATEMPQMLEQHGEIRAANEKLRAIARAEGDAAVEQLAEELIAHARIEEEVMYPAAILAGEVIRARAQAK